MSGRLWIDITDMSTWTGHLTGTQRVVYEIGRRLQEQDQGIGFFIYDEKARTFYESSLQPVLNNVAASERPADNDAAQVAHTSSLKGSAKAFAVRSYQRLPYGVRSRIKPKYKTMGKNAYRRLRGARARAKQRRSILRTTAGGTGRKPLIFGSEDRVMLLGKPWDTMSFIEVLRQQKIDQSFTVIHLIYDMIPVYLPHVFGKPLPENYTRYMFEALSITDTVLAISESTKKDVKRFCKDENLPTPKIEVIKLGDSFMPREGSGTAVKELEGADYILCVGTVEIRKNHILLYTAYKEALRQGVKLPRLVIVGGKGWYTTDVLYEFAHDPALKNLVLFPERVTDHQLAWLYQNCLFVVYPSVYEGWGLPIAEALYYGKACLSSNASSMPEVGGDLVDYFSPYDSGQCAALIASYLDSKTRAKKEQAIATRYRSTSWDDTAAEVARFIG